MSADVTGCETESGSGPVLTLGEIEVEMTITFSTIDALCMNSQAVSLLLETWLISHSCLAYPCELQEFCMTAY